MFWDVQIAQVWLVSIQSQNKTERRNWIWTLTLRINPHHIISSTKQTRLEDKRRRNALGIPSFPASFGEDKKNILWDALPGFPNGAAYFVQAQNRFQKRVRRDMRDEDGEEAEVSGQYTTKFNGRVIEAWVSCWLSMRQRRLSWGIDLRTCTVPLEPGACHKGWQSSPQM
jgi:hypothetical protein